MSWKQRSKGALLAAAAYAVGVGSVVAYRHVVGRSPTDYQSDHYRERVATFHTFPEDGAFVVMLGDSLTEFVDWKAALPGEDVANRGVAGDTVRGLLNRIDEGLPRSARTAFVMVGVNDLLAGNPPAAIMVDYGALVEHLRGKGLTVFVQSTLFVGRQYRVRAGAVGELDEGLRRLCAAGGCSYLDLNAALSDGAELRPEFTAGGLHLNGAGYAAWAAAVRSALCRGRTGTPRGTRT